VKATNAELTGLFLTHEDLEGIVEETAALAENLDGNPGDESVAADLESAVEDLRRRIDDHMTAEESWVFPAMTKAGAPAPLITALLAAHEELRRLGRQCKAPTCDAAGVLAYVGAFRKHADYEEQSLAHFWAKAHA
jgi:iron-sulfur cluster repair protein YtfE (RIC family)